MKHQAIFFNINLSLSLLIAFLIEILALQQQAVPTDLEHEIIPVKIMSSVVQKDEWILDIKCENKAYLNHLKVFGRSHLSVLKNKLNTSICL